jgi:hypothetical protein
MRLNLPDGSPEPERMADIEARMDKLAPLVLPSGWRLIGDYSNARQYVRRDGLQVISEVSAYDGKLWLHVSCCYQDRLPGWGELRKVKDLFIGPKRRAIQVLPPESEYVNIHPYVLHLWAPLEHEPLPDFRKNGAV